MSLDELPEIGGTSFNQKAAVSWLEQQPEDRQSLLADHVFEKLLFNASQPRQSSGSACSKLCGFVEMCSKSASPVLKHFAFAHTTSMKMFNYFIEWNEQDAHRSMRLVLDHIVSSIMWNPDADVSKSIKNAILDDTISVITLQASRPSTKSSMIAIDHFLQKKVVYLSEVLLVYQHLREETRGLEALWDSFISQVFAWMELQHVWTVAGKLLVTILTQPWYRDDKSSKHHPNTWHKFILSGLKTNIELLEPIKVYVFIPLFRTDPTSTLVYLNELTSLQKLTTNESGGWDLNAMLWVALLEAGKKTGVVGESNHASKHSAGVAAHIQTQVLDTLLCHASHEARASGMSILVASPSTTKPYALETLGLLRKHTPSFHEDVDPKIRYDVLGHSRNMIRRLHNSTLRKESVRASQRSQTKTLPSDHTDLAPSSDKRSQTEGQPGTKENLVESPTGILHEHEEFIKWYTSFLKQELMPTASYQRHITSLRAMSYFLKSSLIQGDAASINCWPANLLIDDIWFRSVLDLLMDPYDDVRETAASLIMLLQVRGSMSGPPARVNGLLSTPFAELQTFCQKANDLALKTARADHCDGAARSQELLFRWSSNFEEATEVLNSIFSNLEGKLCAAERDLAAAVLQAPVHGDFASLGYIWRSITGIQLDQRYLIILDRFQDRAISFCQRIWQAVQHILCDDSPEGHLPEELQQIEGLDTKDLLSYSFRAIHESSNLLRTIAQNARYDRKQGFLAPSRQNFEDIGNLTFDELSNLRHRGAFSTVSQTFTACCQLVQCIPAHQRDVDLLQKWWAIRNCGLLLLRSLIDNLFGTNETKSAMEAGWDGRTVRIAYHKFEALPSLLVNLLELGKKSSGITIGTQTAEAVFPALDIIRRAGPPEGHLEKLLHGALLTIRFLLERLLQVMPEQFSEENIDVVYELLSDLAASSSCLHECTEAQAVYMDILNFMAKTLRTQPNWVLQEHGIIRVQQERGQKPLALLNIRIGERSVQQASWETDEEASDILDQELETSLATDINVTCGILEAISRGSLPQTRVARSRLASTYVSICLATKAPEPRAAALEGLASLLDVVLSSTSEDITLGIVPSEKKMLTLWLDLEQKPVNSSLSDAIIRVSGPLVAISLIRARGQIDEDLAQRLRSWGTMMSDAGIADRTFDTRIAAIEAIGSLAATTRFPSANSDGNPSKIHQSHLPWLLALYDALTDDDVEVREAAAGAAKSILGLELVPAEAGSRLLCWLAGHFGHESDFLTHVGGRMVGHNFGSTCFVATHPAGEDVPEVNGLDWVPAESQLAEAMRFDDSLFVVEEHNQYIDEVREAKRWADVFLSSVSSTEKRVHNSVTRALAEWTLAGLRTLARIAETESAADGDGPLGWTSKPEVFAISLDMHRQNASLFTKFLLVAANLFLPVAIVIFATGFFPYKPFLPGLAHHEELSVYGSPPDAPFDKLVFMVVDALRSDFVYLEDSGFEYTRSLINDGVAIPFTAHATSPTITMPRIKAMTTGTTPSFLDAILSFDEADTSSTLASQDTWLAQMRAKNTGKLVMYGDDTWLKLFPGTFDRADGTTSFFVSDFTEVDNNVTRHIADELRNDDWNTMVLHYLGLDHIGHKTGPRGPNMIPKQQEMDAIVREIHEAMGSHEHLQSTLLVLCGDHGMNDAGNHGASSPGETSAALVFMSPKLKGISRGIEAPAKFAEDFQYYSTVEQSDLAPTLAALLGFPIPKNSLGSFIPDFLPLWPEPLDNLQILVRNARQILAIVTATLGGSSSDSIVSEQDCRHANSPSAELICEWREISKANKAALENSARYQDSVSDISRWLSKAQKLMSGMASNYDVDRLIYGGIVTAAAVSTAGMATIMSTKLTIRNFVPFSLITVLYGVMMFASSYVEEEQHFWYWSTTAWLFYLIVKRARKSAREFCTMALLALGMMRLMRGWNQTGQKFAGEPDIVTTFLVPNPALLWALVWSTYFMVGRELLNKLTGIPTVISGSVVAGVVTSAVAFKLTFTQHDAPELVIGVAKLFANFFDGPSLVTQARAVFMGIGLAAIYPVYLVFFRPTKSSKIQALHALHHLYTLFALNQSRATNIPLFLLFHGINIFLTWLNLDPAEVTVSSLLLQFTSFFAMGGSNAFTGIDLSSAYNGISGFNVIAVGALTFISNWAGPVWWTSASNLMLLSIEEKSCESTTSDGRRKSGEGYGDSFTRHASLLTLYMTASLGSVMAACTALRTHLFIWTVFSPKYLYSIAWSLGQHLVINIGFGGLLFWLGQR
ncbi:hypothetical protein O1611_g4314 [Lasiodiplodia mahajangana]|uniref:Uncharacterized protein n=1 Tax=Lasiodiplodia mahajangana TaxID=1108764 RepID=A0ACC2JPN9_9PEZI|nr:hypothetical protein O1611_g4314 [Lasiodiplodia mahajangana]